jgi:hypothetical protein
MMASRRSTHEETWLQLPWLANGRLSGAERAAAEDHVAGCAECRGEFERQRLMCHALTEPDRVTYAPGPSFRKLLERIDGPAPAASRPPGATSRPVALRGARGATLTSAWRPPGLAWAATFVLAVGLFASSAYQLGQPRFTVRTEHTTPEPGVLHVAFDRSLPLGELEQMLRTAGARVVEGPDASGIFGLAPLEAAATPQAAVSPQMRALAARLRADARVRWIQPLSGAAGTEGGQGRPSGGS